MADKPSRALIIYGDGSTRFIEPSHSHLHSLASIASCGFLSLPNSPSSETEDERVVREFAVLLDAYEAYLNSSGDTAKYESHKKSSIPTISERFMGMKAALLTSNRSLESFSAKLGFTVLEYNTFSRNSSSVASRVLELLGFQDGKTQDTSEFDLVFVHIKACEEDRDVADNIGYLNSLVGDIMNVVQPGSEVSSRLHFSVVASYGSVSEDDNSSDTSVFITKDEKNGSLSKLFPRQSYTMRGEDQRTDVRHYCPMLVAQWQHAVTRKDTVETFSFKDFKELGCNLVIPADRFVHEVAFKLWKAPKYGA